MCSFTTILWLTLAAVGADAADSQAATGIVPPLPSGEGAVSRSSSESVPPVPSGSKDLPAHYPGATEVLKCSFEPTHDEEVYGWPPGWTRRHGPGFPRYVQIRVNDERPPTGGRCLRVELNGGAASAFGPSIPVEPGVEYVLEGYVQTAGLRQDAAWLSLSFLDANRARLSNANSSPVEGTTAWQKVCIGPVTPPASSASLIVGVHIASKSDVQDLHGSASFGSLWVGRLPRVVLTARATDAGTPSSAAADQSGDLARSVLAGSASETSFQVFAKGKPIDIGCLVSGFAAAKYDVRLTLEDAGGHTLAQHRESYSRAPSGGATYTTWQIPGNAPGFYRIRAEAVTSPPAVDLPQSIPRTTLAVAIIDPQLPAADSEFGWSLAPDDAALGLLSLGDLLAQSSVRSIKFPFVCKSSPKPATEPAKNDGSAVASPKKAASGQPKPEAKAAASKRPSPERIEPLINFSDRMATAGVRLVGVLLPPKPATEPGQPAFALLAAEAFAADADTWYPSIEPVLGRLANEIRYWQIGDDRDPGWTGCNDLTSAVSRVKAALDRIGQDVNVGIAWSLTAPRPLNARDAAIARSTAGAPSGHQREAMVGDGRRNVSDENRLKPGLRAPQSQAPWRFLSIPCDDAVSDAELASRLDGAASAGVARWLSIEALPCSNYGADDRIAHLVGRMLTAKMHGAEGIFFARPLDAERGLVGRDGSPTELFLPWRTTALMLGGASYAGDIDLASGNRIRCFGSHGKYVGMVASDSPRREFVYLGDDLQSCDLWGRVLNCRPLLDVARTSESVAQKPDESASPSYNTLVGEAPASAARSIVEVNRLPTFLTGLDGPITEWQLNTRFVPKELPSIPASPASVTLEMKNTLPRAVAGRISIVPPPHWDMEPRVAEFRIEPGAVRKLPLEVVLPSDAVGGRQMVALELEIQADRVYHFVMYRPIEVTLGDIAMDGRAKLNGGSDLEVGLSLNNRGKRAASFRCDLLAPDRQRQSTELLVPPRANSEYVFLLPGGRDLLGKALWLQAKEIDGPRVLNYRLDVPTEAK